MELLHNLKLRKTVIFAGLIAVIAGIYIYNLLFLNEEHVASLDRARRPLSSKLQVPFPPSAAERSRNAIPSLIKSENDIRIQLDAILHSLEDSEKERRVIVSHVTNDKLSHLTLWLSLPEQQEITKIQKSLRNLEAEFIHFPDQKEEFDGMVSLIKDFISFGSNQTTGDSYKIRFVALDLPKNNDEPAKGYVTSAMNGEWGIDPDTGVPWQKYEGDNRLVRIGPKTMDQRYGHLFSIQEN